jgi:ATP-binding cassette, subfamily B, bacterial
MLRSVWRMLAPLLPSKGSALFTLISVSLASAFLEAGVLVLVVSITLAIADGKSQVDMSLPLVTDVAISAAMGLAIAGGAAVASLVAHALIARLGASLAAGTIRNARDRVLLAYAAASWERQAADREGALQQAVSVLAHETSQIATQVANLSLGLAGLVGLLSVAGFVDPVVTLIVIAFGGLIFAVLRPISAITRRNAQEAVEDNSRFAERVSGWTTLAMEFQVFGTHNVQRESLRVANRRAAQATYRARLAARLGSSLYRDLAVVFLVGAVALLYNVSANLTAVGAVVLLVVRAIGYAQQVQNALQSINEHSPALSSLIERVETLERDVRTDGSRELASVDRIELRAVGYDYRPDRPGIDDINLVVERGEAIGVIGPSGGGKSTLTQVLLRLRVPTRGTVLVSGLPYEEYSADSWHRLVASVPQEPRLFEGSVADNIRFFRAGIDDSAIERAAADAHVLEDVRKLRDGFDTMLGPRGAGLSGGQKQRIAIARALVGSPQLLVLDEPTSALDQRSERLLQETMESLRGRITLVIVAHRMATLASCDRVLAMVEGTIRTVGTLEDALNTVALAEVAPKHRKSGAATDIDKSHKS